MDKTKAGKDKQLDIQNKIDKLVERTPKGIFVDPINIPKIEQLLRSAKGSK